MPLEEATAGEQPLKPPLAESSTASITIPRMLAAVGGGVGVEETTPPGPPPVEMGVGPVWLATPLTGSVQPVERMIPARRTAVPTATTLVFMPSRPPGS